MDDETGSAPVSAMDVPAGTIAWTAGSGHSWAVAFDTASVFWTSASGLQSADKGGGSTPKVLGPCASECDAVVADDANVVWATLGDVTEALPNGTQPRTLASGYGGIHHAAMDSTSAYWTDSVGGGVWSIAR